MYGSWARRVADSLRMTPLHPQWLLGGKKAGATWLTRHLAGRTLDIGCADRWVEQLMPAGGEYLGLDYPVTGKHMYGACPDVFANAAKLPLPDRCMDTVVIQEVLEHLREPREALGEIARVLRPGGKVLLTMPFLYPIHDAPHDYQRFTAHGLIREVEAVGLDICALEQSLDTARTAGLLLNLALAGIALESIRQRRFAMVFVPLLLAAIPLVNLTAWVGGWVLPAWPAMGAGYRLVARTRG